MRCNQPPPALTEGWLPVCGGIDPVLPKGNVTCAEENDLMLVEGLFIYKGLKMTSI